MTPLVVNVGAAPNDGMGDPLRDAFIKINTDFAASWNFTVAGLTISNSPSSTDLKTAMSLQNVDNTSDANKPVSTATQTALNLKANLDSPALTGSPTAPTQAGADNSTKIATTAFVAAAVAGGVAGVASFNTRTGAVTLTSGDVTTALSYTPTSVTGLTGVQSVSAFKTGLSLNNVDNTSDASKPISTATQSALDLKQNLDATLTALAGVTTAADKLIYCTGVDTFSTTDFGSVARTLNAQTSQANMRTTGLGMSANGSSLVSAADYAAMKTLLSLNNVDNTSDANKPVSTATQTALNLKADLASPALSGNPTAPTQAPGDNTTKIATTAFVTAAVAGGVAGVASFNGRTGAVTLTSSDVTTALTYTPADAAAVTDAAHGGTGQSSYVVGDLIQASASTTLSKLAAVATGNVLLSGGVTTVSAWGKVGLTTHVTGTLPVANGGTGITVFGTGVATALGVNIGSTGAVVVQNGALGTPSSATLTSATGLPISTGVSGLGTGVATFLATPSSANLAAALTDETGSGANVFATSPTLVTPLLGTPTSGNLSNCTADGANAIGYRNIPQNAKTGSYTLLATDVGKSIPNTTGGVTVNNSVFAAGDVVLFYNDSGSDQTVTQGSGVTMRLAGTATTGNRTVAQRGLATMYFKSASECVVSGPGVT